MNHYKYNCIIIMGICGCGKSTVGSHLAKTLRVPFFDADDFHPPENVTRMRKGKPLTDELRHTWLAALRSKIKCLRARAQTAVFSCSALKKSYRAVLHAHSGVCFIHLRINQATAEQRMMARKNHFMPPKLVNSQLKALEFPDTEELSTLCGGYMECEATMRVEQLTEQIVQFLSPNVAGI